MTQVDYCLHLAHAYNQAGQMPGRPDETPDVPDPRFLHDELYFLGG